MTEPPCGSGEAPLPRRIDGSGRPGEFLTTHVMISFIFIVQSIKAVAFSYDNEPAAGAFLYLGMCFLAINLKDKNKNRPYTCIRT